MTCLLRLPQTLVGHELAWYCPLSGGRVRRLVVFLILGLSACSEPGILGDEQAWRSLEVAATGSAPLLGSAAVTGERYLFRLRANQGLKVWLEFEGEIVARLGLRSEWDGQSSQRQEAVALFLRDEPLNVQEIAYRNIVVTMALGKALGSDAWGPALTYSRVDKASYAVPWERARIARPLVDVRLVQGTPQTLAEYDYGQGPVALKVEVVSTGG